MSLPNSVNQQLPLPSPTNTDGTSIVRTLTGWANGLVQALLGYGEAINQLLAQVTTNTSSISTLNTDVSSPANTIKGNNTGATATMKDLTPTQVNALLGVTTNGTAAVGQLPGTSTNDNAAAGKIGEDVEATISSGSAVGLTTITPANVTSISLTAGDWDVSGSAKFTGGASTTILWARGAVSTTSGSLDTTPSHVADKFLNNATPFNSIDISVNAGPLRLSLSSTTSVYLVAQANFGSSTCSAYGNIRARRVR